MLSGGLSRGILLSPEFGAVLNAVDGFVAGMANALTAGLSTRLRTLMWGETASRNHSGMWFEMGNAVGSVMSMVIMAGGPCGLSGLGRIGALALNGTQIAGGVINAGQNIYNGNYLGAALDILGVAGNVAQFARACFAGDMEVLTRRGYVRWDAVTEQDDVASCDEYNPLGAIEFKRVEEIFVARAEICHVHVRGEVIRTTAEHPFYVWGKGWVPAKELNDGDKLRSDDGQMVAVDEVFYTGEVETVYNCRVQNFHTYFVGKAGWQFAVWAHNACFWRTAEERSIEAARRRGEGIINSQWGGGRGFDFLSFSGTGRNARLFVNEVKSYSHTVPTSRFTAFGLGRGGPAIFERNLDKAREAIRAARDAGDISRTTMRSLLSQLDDATARIRLIGPRSVFDASSVRFIRRETGFRVQVGF